MSVNLEQVYEHGFLHFDIAGRVTTVGALRTWFLRQTPGVTAENVDQVTAIFIEEAQLNGRLHLARDRETGHLSERTLWLTNPWRSL